jgi:hypothetical protein
MCVIRMETRFADYIGRPRSLTKSRLTLLAQLSPDDPS